MSINNHLMSIGEDGKKRFKLVDQLVKSFHVAHTFHEDNNISAIDFSPSGEYLISCNKGDRISIYECDVGRKERSVQSRKYGVDLIRFVHHNEHTVIHSSTKLDYHIRYLNMPDNNYIRYYTGHTMEVTALCMSPTDHTFVSASLDQTLRLWDLRTPNCQGLMQLTGRPVAAIDPESSIFAVGTNSELIKLYDLRSYDKGPFVTFKLKREIDCEWTEMKFSNDGTKILITTNGSIIRLIDAFKGIPLQVFKGHSTTKSIPIQATFSPDSQYVISGSNNGRVHFWNADSGCEVSVLKGIDFNPIQFIQFNPKYMMMATAYEKTDIWLPSCDAEDKA